jgi:hypothetical protein
MKQESIDKIQKWLGVDGIKFFMDLKKKHGRVDSVYMEQGIPHPVHLREGIQVRNFLRSLPECKDWDDHKLDDNWVSVIEEILNQEKEQYVTNSSRISR